MVSLFPPGKRPLNESELKKASSEADPIKKDILYRNFEIRNIRDPYIIPICLAGNAMSFRKNIIFKGGMHSGNGLKFWNLSVQ
jgi:hypothetical protein